MLNKRKLSTPKVLRWDVGLWNKNKQVATYHCYSSLSVERMKETLSEQYPKYAITVDEVQ